jgi:hypothetical protein
LRGSHSNLRRSVDPLFSGAHAGDSPIGEAGSRIKKLPNEYSPDALSCLMRAAALVESGNEAALLYAALELRFGIEARLHDIKDAHQEAVKMKKGAWEIAKIGNNIERAFQIGDKVCVLTIKAGEEVRTIYYTPVSKELRQIGMRLGAFLHSDQSARSYTTPWWNELRTNLMRGVDLLSSTCAGALLGPPLARRGTNQFHLRINMDVRDQNAREFGELVKKIGLGTTHPVHIDYLPSLPVEANWVAPLLPQLHRTE